MAIIDELKRMFREGNVVIKIIYINVGVFLFVNIVHSIFYLFQSPGNGFDFESLGIDFRRFLAVPSDIESLIRKPWTLLTYMFYHEEFMHILGNLLWFFLFGRIFLEYLDEKKLVSIYILGGLSGASLFILFFNIFPAFQTQIGAPMLGASASIMAVGFAITFYVPNYEVNLFIFGRIKIKYITMALIIYDVVMMRHENAGGHIAHLGGALYGYFFIAQYKKGKNIARGYDTIGEGIRRMFRRRKRMNVTYRRTPADDYDYNKSKVDKQKEIDRILDKIAKGGYNNLSKEEKDFLFRSSK